MSEGAPKAAHAPDGLRARSRSSAQPPLGRYEVLAEIGSGGMATVQFGRLHAPHGFVRSVAIKRLHAQFAKDPDFVRMFIDEARLSARLTHANIVATLDIIDAPGELGLVMEYVHGESLWSLLRLAAEDNKPVPVRVATALAAGVLHGLQAAHDATDERGQPLGIVHRDVSPHNILVGSDGMARLIDFGVAKAFGKLRATPSGEIKGKLLYMAPEQLGASYVDHRADVYGASAVLWETLTGGAPFDDSEHESAVIHAVLLGRIDPPSLRRHEVPSQLDAIVMQGLARDPQARFASARDMALALERDVGIASQSELAAWLHDLAGPELAARARLIARVQASSASAGVVSTPLLAATTARIPADDAMPEDAAQSPIGVRRRRDTPTGSTARTQRPRLWYAVYAAIATLFAISAALWISAARRSGQQAASKTVVQAVHSASRAEVGTDNAPTPAAGEKHHAEGESAQDPQPSARTPRDRDAPLPAVQVDGDQLPAAEGALPANTGNASRAPRPDSADPQRAIRRAAPEAARGSPAASRAQCKPWFYIDESGIRRPKPGCL